VEGAVSGPRGRRALAAALLLAAGAPAAAAPPGRRARARPAPPAVVLDGERRAVRWTDGDTFRLLEGPSAGKSARLVGYNALESYGPVHRWGSWRPAELLAVAQEAARRARSGEWRCSSRGGEDAYGRLLVACPDAARTLVGEGLAMAFAVDEPPDPELAALQREAQARGAGMWRKGVPPLLPSSLHSAGEPGLEGEPYDRIVDTRTGKTEVRRHRRAYRTCQEVCVGEGAGRACMVYVPFERRYRDRPACLRVRRPGVTRP
jgi:endonuclease YncB( thermonuclease family)